MKLAKDDNHEEFPYYQSSLKHEENESERYDEEEEAAQKLSKRVNEQ